MNTTSTFKPTPLTYFFGFNMSYSCYGDSVFKEPSLSSMHRPPSGSEISESKHKILHPYFWSDFNYLKFNISYFISSCFSKSLNAIIGSNFYSSIGIIL